MNSKTSVIGLLGGSFDPVHLGHIHLASMLYQQLGLSEIRFIPSYQPLLREQPHASPEQRLAMLQLAIVDYPFFSIDDRELKQQQTSYTYNTLLSLRQELPQTPLAFIIGADRFEHFEQWYRWQELIGLAHFIIAARPHYSLTPNSTIQTFITQHQIIDYRLLQQKPAGYFLLQSIPLCAISATEIRRLLKTNQAVDQFLTPKVIEFIKAEQLYR